MAVRGTGIVIFCGKFVFTIRCFSFPRSLDLVFKGNQKTSALDNIGERSSPKVNSRSGNRGLGLGLDTLPGQFTCGLGVRDRVRDPPCQIYSWVRVRSRVTSPVKKELQQLGLA